MEVWAQAGTKKMSGFRSAQGSTLTENLNGDQVAPNDGVCVYGAQRASTLDLG